MKRPGAEKRGNVHSLPRAAAEAAVSFLLEGSELQHIAENRDCAAGPAQARERRERGLHRRRRGVVAVVEDRDSARPSDHTGTMRIGPRSGEAPGDFRSEEHTSEL